MQVNQLQIEKQQAEAMTAKANAFALVAQTNQDELMFKIASLNPNSEIAQQWMMLKLQEGLDPQKD